ncbi:hypothetical protein HY745_12135 [Candidatus Desantisbacteria bacterium]|nr:hypothetical protein [Candidatus Desantisbacteria bacterium]
MKFKKSDGSSGEISDHTNNLIKTAKLWYIYLTDQYNKNTDYFKAVIKSLFGNMEKFFMDIDIKRMEYYEYTKLKLWYFLMLNWFIPNMEGYYIKSDIENIKSTGRSLDMLFDLKEKMLEVRSLHETDRLPFIEIETLLEEKSRIFYKQKENFFAVTQNMLQYYTSDISIGIFLIIIIFIIYFSWIILRI